MHWYKVSMTTEQVINGEHGKVQNDFEKLFISAGGPKDMVLFGSLLSPDGLDLFFSPHAYSYAKDLIDSYGGVPCENPPPKETPLLVG